MSWSNACEVQLGMHLDQEYIDRERPIFLLSF